MKFELVKEDLKASDAGTLELMEGSVGMVDA